MSKKLESIFVSTSTQKVLKFLSNNIDKELYDSEIQRALSSISMASVNNSLRELFTYGLTSRIKKGKISINKLKDLPELKLFKQLLNIIEVREALAPASKFIDQAVLYGSCAKGENTSTSDIDVFIVSDNPSKTRSILSHNNTLQLVIKKKSELIRFRKENSEFYEEIQQGIRIIDNYEETI